MIDIVALKQIIIEATELAALAVLRLQNPAFDEVTKTEAYKIAGSRRWLDYHIKAGHIEPIRRGRAANSPVYYSRLDIAALKKAEAKLAFNNEAHRKTGVNLNDYKPPYKR